MTEYIYGAYIDFGYGSRPDRIVLGRITVVKRTDKQVWVGRVRATGYSTRLDANHGGDLNLGVTPEEAMGKLRDRLNKERDAIQGRLAEKVAQIRLAGVMPEITEETP